VYSEQGCVLRLVGFSRQPKGEPDGTWHVVELYKGNIKRDGLIEEVSEVTTGKHDVVCVFLDDSGEEHG
jgi:hypothetical protein